MIIWVFFKYFGTVLVFADPATELNLALHQSPAPHRLEIRVVLLKVFENPMFAVLLVTLLALNTDKGDLQKMR